MVDALAALELDDAVLDGEIVALGGNGAPDFGLLQQRMGLTKPGDVARAQTGAPVTLLVFDVLRAGGHGKQNDEYAERRLGLDKLGVDDGETILVPAAYDGSLKEAITSSKKLGLEGVLAKRRDSRYVAGKRSSNWIKIKHQRMQEVVIGGWREGNGSRADTIGSLLLGIPDDGGLRYIGRVGTGFNDKTLAELGRALRPLERKTSPFVDVPKDVLRDAHWVTPRIVGEVAFSEWTRSGHLRHPSWRGRRTDKDPREVILE